MLPTKTTETSFKLGIEDDNFLACEVFEEISYSKKSDSKETIFEIRQHNEVYQLICIEIIDDH